MFYNSPIKTVFQQIRLQQNLYMICCPFYRPKANLFYSEWRKSRVWRDSHVILTNQMSVFHNLQKPDLLQDRFERGSNVAFHLPGPCSAFSRPSRSMHYRTTPGSTWPGTHRPRGRVIRTGPVLQQCCKTSCTFIFFARFTVPSQG